MNNLTIANNLFGAIDIIVDKKIREAGYDSTIVAKIIKIADSALGKYQIQYQDANFQALSVGGGAYAEGDQVYVLVPSNDLSRDKYILGLTAGHRRSTALGDVVTTAQLQAVLDRIKALEDQDTPIITIDSVLSDTSTNPVQNKVITSEITTIKGKITELENTKPSIDLTDYYTKSEVDGKIPNLDGYATEDWVEAQKYLQANDLNDYVTETDLNNKNYLQSGALNGYATQSWVQSQGYKTTDNDTTYQKATDTTLGLVRTGFPESGQYYPVELNTSGQMYVHVPWTDKVGEGADGNTTYTLQIDGNNIALVDSTNTAQSITVPYATKANNANNSTNLNGKASTEYVLQTQLDSYVSTDKLSEYVPLTAVKNKGSKTQPVYFNTNGVPSAIDYTIEKSVPSNAIFTDQNVKTVIANTKYYLTGQTSSVAQTGELVFNTNVYVDTSGNLYSAGNQVLTTLPTATSDQLGGVKIGSNISISNGKISVELANRTTKGVVRSEYSGNEEPSAMNKAVIWDGYVYYTDTDTKYSTVTSSSSNSGLMSVADKKKLDNLPSNLTMSYSNGILSITYTS